MSLSNNLRQGWTQCLFALFFFTLRNFAFKINSTFEDCACLCTCVCVCVCKQAPHRHLGTHIQTTCERKCLANLKRVWICAQYSDPHTFMLSHWQLWVIAPCSSPYPWTAFNYVTKCTCSPALMSPLESHVITFTLLWCEEGPASLNRKNMFFNLGR